MDDQNKILAKAWELFDKGNYQEAEALYLQSFASVHISDTQKLKTVLNGLIYVEAFLKKYDEARKYGNILLQQAHNEGDRHIALHQSGMIERMAGNYEKAMVLFSEEEALIHSAFPDDHLRISANLYEQGYVALKMAQYGKAETFMLMSLDRAVKSKDDMCIGCAYRGMGEIMAVLGMSERSTDYFQKAIAAFANTGDWVAVEEVKAMLP